GGTHASILHLHPHLWCSSSLCLQRFRDHLALHSFPTRRSSDLRPGGQWPRRHLRRGGQAAPARLAPSGDGTPRPRRGARAHLDGDRKSTRLNSSHVSISYAVFCLKKKNNAACMRCSSLS